MYVGIRHWSVYHYHKDWVSFEEIVAVNRQGYPRYYRKRWFLTVGLLLKYWLKYCVRT